MINIVPNNFDSTTTLSGLSVLHTADGKKDTFNLDTIHLTSDGTDLRSDKVGFGLSYTMDGMDFNTSDTSLPMELPHSMKFDMRVKQLPLKSMIEILKTASTQALDPKSEMTEEQRKQMMMISLMSFPKLMAQHGTTLNIEDTRVTSPDLTTTLKGEIKADANALHGAIGKFVLKIAGLENAIAALQSSVGEDGKPSPMAQQLRGALSMAQAMAKAEADGTRSFTFELTPDGKGLMNGMDVIGLMNARQH